MKDLGRFAFWSNIFFLAPLFLAVSQKIIWFIPIIILATLFSSAYHLSGEKKLGDGDTVAALILIVANFVLLYLGKYTPPYFYIALGLVLPAAIFYFRQFRNSYNLNHGLYHFFSALITLFCILTYTY